MHFGIQSAPRDRTVSMATACDDGCTPLHIACGRPGNAEMVGYLIDGGADKNATASSGSFSPLHIAASVGNADIVCVLAEKGAALEQLAAHGLTALMAAAQHGHADVVEVLIKAGANINHSSANGVMALHLSSSEGHIETVEALIAGGADIDRATDTGYTAIEFSAFHGQHKTSQLLAMHGAAYGDALELAMAQGHRELADWLRQSAEWITPLHHLGMLAPERARALLRAGADLYARTPAGGPTPLNLAGAAAARGEAPAGSTAWLVLRAAAPWSPDTHEIMPTTARSRARELLGIGYALARSNLSGCRVDAHALVDVWTAFVLPYAITR